MQQLRDHHTRQTPIFKKGGHGQTITAQGALDSLTCTLPMHTPEAPPGRPYHQTPYRVPPELWSPCTMMEQLSQHAFTLKGFVSASTCDQWIAWSEALGYAPAQFSGGRLAAVRNNDRIIDDHAERAELLWKGLEPKLPKHVLHFEAMRRGAVGPHVACGLNERFRWYRYKPGHRFRRHVDGAFTRDNGETSLWTVLLYLNTVDEGGQTRLWLGRAGTALVVPEPGLLLCFEHRLEHEGVEVLSGVKYVLRTDLMFRRVQR
ncbi:MAG: 2OG-Fe(II) oxygenase [Myxococcota bacterium]